MSLHHVKRIKGRAPQVGDLLARKGSWDRKYRILHIGPGVKENEYNTAFTVTAEYLGRYYADGTCVPVKRPSKRDFEMVHASGGFTPGYYIRWHESVRKSNMKQHDMATFAKTLLEVAPELAAYGLAIRAAAEQGLPMPDFEWSTYCLEAQGSIYDLLKADGEIT